MSTTILDDKYLMVTSYYGGEKVGICLQVSTRNDRFIQLNAEQAKTLR